MNGPGQGCLLPVSYTHLGKLRGLKRQCYEGGIRIPFIVRWPGKVPEGTVNDHQLAFYDLMPTSVSYTHLRLLFLLSAMVSLKIRMGLFII